MTYDRAALEAELARDEGLVLRPYRDSVGKLTIGIGHNLDDRGISTAIARALLAEDITEAELLLDGHLPWWRGLDDVRQRVLLNMAFNLGPRLLSFQNTLGHIAAGRWAEAEAGMLESLWAHQVGPRAKRLAAMMRLGTAGEDVA